MKRADTKLIAEGAEFLVLAHLLMREFTVSSHIDPVDKRVYPKKQILEVLERIRKSKGLEIHGITAQARGGLDS